MTTLSQLADDIVRETRRPDLLADICDYINQTIRELHTEPEKSNVVFFGENLRESQLAANAETGFSWTIPIPALFQKMQTVRYDSIHSREGYVYSVETQPGRSMNTLRHFHYRAGPTIFFSGYGGLNAVISLAWYEFPRRLKYFQIADRPAVWDQDGLEFIYASAFDSSDELRLDARNFVSNWLLLRWRDVIAEGVKAKVYKRVSDDSRSRTSYSLYNQLRNGLITSEAASGSSI